MGYIADTFFMKAKGWDGYPPDRTLRRDYKIRYTSLGTKRELTVASAWDPDTQCWDNYCSPEDLLKSLGPEAHIIP